ncbi:MAG: extracellular solute-binding protein [Clostridia bacterium]|nr:extracellular solute-binding protein [Clostridia bacterium]
MRKTYLWPLLLVMAMLLAVPGAYAEGSFSMAGYDDESTGHDWTNNLFFERMQERTGLTLDLQQYTKAEDWQKAKADMLAGKADMPDALFKAALTMEETQQLFDAGLIIDLAPLMQEHAPNLYALLEAHPEWRTAITMPGGQIAALPYIDEMQFNNCMWINDNWLRQLALTPPATTQELTEVLRAFKANDLNGNGKDDEIPLTFATMWDLRFLLHGFGVNANDYYVGMDENGQIRQILTTDENRAFLEWLRSLWEEELLDRGGFTGLQSIGGTPSKDTPVTYGMMFTSTPANLVYVDNVTQYTVLEPLTYGGQQVYRDLTGDVIRGAFAISSACKDPAALLAWADYLYTEEGFILSEAGQAGAEFDWNDDGTWMWTDSAETLMNVTLPSATLRSGTAMPGYASIAFQKKLDDATTVHIINELSRLKEADSLPCPQVWMTQEQLQRVNELIMRVGSYAEQQMVWFVAGDVELNDETWAEFCKKVTDLGADEIAKIFQQAVDGH